MLEGWGPGDWIKFTVSVVLGALIWAYILKPWFLQRRSCGTLPPGKIAWPFWDESLAYLKSMTSFHDTGKWIDERRARYGDIFKARVFFEPTVFALGSKANRFILSNDLKLFRNSWPKTMGELAGTSSILVVHGEQHRRIRWYLEQFFGTDSIKIFMSSMENSILRCLERWQGEDIVQVNPELHLLTFTMVCEFMLGGSKDVDLVKMKQDFDFVGRNLICLPINLPWTQYGKALRARNSIHKVIYSEIRKRRTEWESGLSPLGQGGRLSSRNIELARDLLDLFMFWEGNPESGKQWELNDTEIAQNMVVALLASHGTSTSSMTSVLYHLRNRSDIIQELRREYRLVGESKKPGEPLSWNDTRKMQYTRKVILESLRLHTTVAQISKRTLCDIQLEGYTIPKGWVVTLCGNQTHSKEEIFPSAEEFNPSRFDENHDLYSFIPFGRGPRMCPGEKFAMVFMEMFMYHFLPQFDYELVNNDEEFVMFFGPVPKQGMPIKLKSLRAKE